MSNTMQEQLRQSQPRPSSQFSQQSSARQQEQTQSRPKANQPESIRELAYRLWEEAGCPEGQPERFWLEAEARISRNKGTRT